MDLFMVWRVHVWLKNTRLLSLVNAPFCVLLFVTNVFLVFVELVCVGMAAFSVVARYYLWRKFFEVLLIVCLVFLALGVACYIFTLLKARHMQLVVQEIYAKKARPNGTRPRRTRLQMLPFLLLLFVLFMTYFPFILIRSLPIKLTMVTDRIAWISVDVVGIWNLLTMLIGLLIGALFERNTSSKAMLRNNSLVKKNNASITGTHSFSRLERENCWRVSPEVVPFGSSCQLDSDEQAPLIGDIEQSPQGVLIRWTKRASKHVHHSVVAAGLPLDKFQLFIDATLENLFPKEDLLPVRGGFCLVINVAPPGHEAHQRQLDAIREFEEASLLCKALWHDQLVSLRDSRGRIEVQSADQPADDEDDSPLQDIVVPDEPQEMLEQAQKDWAYQEARFKLSSSIQAVLRCRRVSEPVTPATRSLDGEVELRRCFIPEGTSEERSSDGEWKTPPTGESSSSTDL